MYKQARDDNCNFFKASTESNGHVLQCTHRDTFVTEALKKAEILLEKGASNIMIKYIIGNIQAWRKNNPPVICPSNVSAHEILLNETIKDQ